jgi:hypothetical protein
MELLIGKLLQEQESESYIGMMTTIAPPQDGGTLQILLLLL